VGRWLNNQYHLDEQASFTKEKSPTADERESSRGTHRREVVRGTTKELISDPQPLRKLLFASWPLAVTGQLSNNVPGERLHEAQGLVVRLEGSLPRLPVPADAGCSSNPVGFLLAGSVGTLELEGATCMSLFGRQPYMAQQATVVCGARNLLMPQVFADHLVQVEEARADLLEIFAVNSVQIPESIPKGNPR